MDDRTTTKIRLLRAASVVFAEKGYRDATVAEICDAAGANIAAVNYHFGDKEHLYDAVWNEAFNKAAQAYPIDGNLPEDPGLEDYIFSYASAMLHRIFSETDTGLFARLLYREMASPTLALDHISKEVLKPQGEFLQRAILSSTEPPLEESRLRLCLHGIIGMCAFYNFSRPLRERILGRKTMSEDEIDETARFIAGFSLGGLNAIIRKQTP